MNIIYNVIDGEEKRIKGEGSRSLDSFVASLCKNPKTIFEFNQFHKEISGGEFYEEGPKNLEELSNYVIAERGISDELRGKFLCDIELKDGRVLNLYKTEDSRTTSKMRSVTTGFLRSFYDIKYASDEDVLKRFEMGVRDYDSFKPDERVNDAGDIPEITPGLIKEWENSPEKKKYPTVRDYRRSIVIDGIDVEGIVVADLRTRRLRYLTDPNYFDIPRERPSAEDKESIRKCGWSDIEYEYSLPLEWELIKE